jgi:hypothetical protein
MVRVYHVTLQTIDNLQVHLASYSMQSYQPALFKKLRGARRRRERSEKPRRSCVREVAEIEGHTKRTEAAVDWNERNKQAAASVPRPLRCVT